MIVRILILFLFCSFNCVKSQTYLYFQDSSNPDFLDESWMECTSPSELEREGEDLRKFPVESNIKAHQGLNCLSLKWKSSNSGSWLAIAAGKDWQAQNIVDTDTLSFWIYSIEGIASKDFPEIFLEDINNKKSSFIQLSIYTKDITKSTWKKIKVPMNAFFQADRQIDWSQVKTIGFTQGIADNSYHTLLVDDFRVYKGNLKYSPLKPPIVLSAKGYDSHVRLTWKADKEPNLEGFEIYQSDNNGESYELREITDKSTFVFNDFVRDKGTKLNLFYKISALNDAGISSSFSDSISVSIREYNDDELLTMVQEANFRYFWDFAHPDCGMARERNTSGDIVATGGSGFGIMAIIVGIERGFISRQEGSERILKILKFLDIADRFHGAWPHWLDGSTGKVVPFSLKDNGGDILETALMMQGLLTARQYFDQSNTIEKEIVSKINYFWESIEWNWFRRNNQSVLYWHWSPDYEWQMDMPVRGWNECMIIYLLAIASPTHSVPASLWYTGWAGSGYRNGKSFYGYKLDVGWDYGGPLFFTHFSFTGLNPHYIKDTYTDYFENNKKIAQINHEYCVRNPKSFTGYSDSCWGLSASDDPFVYYLAHEPASDKDNGTICPTAALSSIVYTPDYSIAALKYFYRSLGKRLWGEYGFYDAFNPQINWYASSYLAVDQGPIVAMIENYRTGLLWKYFMANPEIKPAIEAIGINSSSKENIQLPGNLNFTVSPNPVKHNALISFQIPGDDIMTLSFYNLNSQIIKILFKDKHFNKGENSIQLIPNSIPDGFYILELRGFKNSFYKIIIFQK